MGFFVFFCHGVVFCAISQVRKRIMSSGPVPIRPQKTAAGVHFASDSSPGFASALDSAVNPFETSGLGLSGTSPSEIHATAVSHGQGTSILSFPLAPSSAAGGYVYGESPLTSFFVGAKRKPDQMAKSPGYSLTSSVSGPGAYLSGATGSQDRSGSAKSHSKKKRKCAADDVESPVGAGGLPCGGGSSDRDLRVGVAASIGSRSFAAGSGPEADYAEDAAALSFLPSARRRPEGPLPVSVRLASTDFFSGFGEMDLWEGAPPHRDHVHTAVLSHGISADMEGVATHKTVFKESADDASADSDDEAVLMGSDEDDELSLAIALSVENDFHFPDDSFIREMQESSIKTPKKKSAADPFRSAPPHGRPAASASATSMASAGVAINGLTFSAATLGTTAEHAKFSFSDIASAAAAIAATAAAVPGDVLDLSQRPSSRERSQDSERRAADGVDAAMSATESDGQQQQQQQLEGQQLDTESGTGGADHPDGVKQVCQNVPTVESDVHGLSDGRVSVADNEPAPGRSSGVSPMPVGKGAGATNKITEDDDSDEDDGGSGGPFAGSIVVPLAGGSGVAIHGPNGAVFELRPDDDNFSQSRLAEIFGLPGRFRDYKRSLFDNNKMKPSQVEFMERDSEHRELTLRLPHRITAAQFAFRIMLMAFHFALRDGRHPSFWKKLSHNVLFSCMTREICVRFDPSVGVHSFQFFGDGMDYAHAIERAQKEAVAHDVLPPLPVSAVSASATASPKILAASGSGTDGGRSSVSPPGSASLSGSKPASASAGVPCSSLTLGPAVSAESTGADKALGSLAVFPATPREQQQQPGKTSSSPISLSSIPATVKPAVEGAVSLPAASSSSSSSTGGFGSSTSRHGPTAVSSTSADAPASRSGEIAESGGCASIGSNGPRASSQSGGTTLSKSLAHSSSSSVVGKLHAQFGPVLATHAIGGRLPGSGVAHDEDLLTLISGGLLPHSEASEEDISATNAFLVFGSETSSSASSSGVAASLRTPSTGGSGNGSTVSAGTSSSSSLLTAGEPSSGSVGAPEFLRRAVPSAVLGSLHSSRLPSSSIAFEEDFDAIDAASMMVNRHGGVFFGDQLLPHAESVSAVPTVGGRKTGGPKRASGPGPLPSQPKLASLGMKNGAPVGVESGSAVATGSEAGVQSGAVVAAAVSGSGPVGSPSFAITGGPSPATVSGGVDGKSAVSASAAHYVHSQGLEVSSAASAVAATAPLLMSVMGADVQHTTDHHNRSSATGSSSSINNIHSSANSVDGAADVSNQAQPSAVASHPFFPHTGHTAGFSPACPACLTLAYQTVLNKKARNQVASAVAPVPSGKLSSSSVREDPSSLEGIPSASQSLSPPEAQAPTPAATPLPGAAGGIGTGMISVPVAATGGLASTAITFPSAPHAAVALNFVHTMLGSSLASRLLAAASAPPGGGATSASVPLPPMSGAGVGSIPPQPTSPSHLGPLAHPSLLPFVPFAAALAVSPALLLQAGSAVALDAEQSVASPPSDSAVVHPSAKMEDA